MLKINGEFFDFEYKGHTLYGYLKGASYEITGAAFNGANYTKDGPQWKRNKRGSLSKAFGEWLEVAENKLYKEFHNEN